MAVRQQNMGDVPAYGEQVPEGCYHFRIDSVKDDGSDIVLMYLKIQQEPFTGRIVRERFDLSNPTALSKLKAYYKATGYEPVGGNHDPEQIVSGEITAVVEHNVQNGTTYANIAPWSIRSISESPVRELGAFT